MKLKHLLFGTLMFTSLFSFSQGEELRECDRMRFLGSKAVEAKNWNEAVTYYIKGEALCGNYDAKQYSILTGSLIRVINAEADKTKKTAYIDTILSVWNRAEKVGAYDQVDDLYRAAYILQTAKPDYSKADTLFVRGIKSNGVATKEAFVSYYYYNLYTLWYTAKDAEKAPLKKRLISEYFELSKLISAANMSVKAQENLTSYFNNVVRTCDDILPDLKGFMGEFSQDPAVKIATVKNFIKILKDKGCTESKEYVQLIDTMILADPNSLEAKEMKAEACFAKKDYNCGISVYRELIGLVSDAAKKQDYTYEIARAQFNQGSYKAAYSTAMSVSGSNKGNALIIAGKCVGQTANSCGESTFERKCNNIYAVQLLTQGGADGGTIGKYKANYPTSQDCFDNGNPGSVALSCWGVSVSPCN